MPLPISQLAPPVVLSFAASDPTGGSGIQSDILTLHAFGIHPATVVTAILARDTRGVESAWPLEPEWIDDQARALLEDLNISAFKVGMLGNAIAVAVVAEIVSDYPDIPLVLDPSLGSGNPFGDEEMPEALRDLLVPLATVLCCNSHEVVQLAADEDSDDQEAGAGEDPESPASSARTLLDLGAGHVLVTGAHAGTPQLINTLYNQQGVVRADVWERLPERHHGAGATLSAAIAAGLALGRPVSEAVHAAQAYTWQTLSESFSPGMGRRLPRRSEPRQ